MLAQVTYIQKLIMADSGDEFMPICIAANAAFVANKPKYLTAGRRAGVGRPAVSNIFDTAGRRRAGIGSTHDARPMHDFGNSHNRCPGDILRRPTMTGRCKIGRPADLLSSRLKAF